MFIFLGERVEYMDDDILFKEEYGHWVVIINGEFFCTADSLMEAVQEVEER